VNCSEGWVRLEASLHRAQDRYYQRCSGSLFTACVSHGHCACQPKALGSESKRGKLAVPAIPAALEGHADLPDMLADCVRYAAKDEL
jgi:hypothetical protein